MFFNPSEDDNSLGLLIITGKNAGNIWVLLPKEAYLEGTRLISTNWLFINWYKWITPNVKFEDVLFLYNNEIRN